MYPSNSETDMFYHLCSENLFGKPYNYKLLEQRKHKISPNSGSTVRLLLFCFFFDLSRYLPHSRKKLSYHIFLYFTNKSGFNLIFLDFVIWNILGLNALSQEWFLPLCTRNSSFSSGHFSSVTQMCPTLWPHGLQHTRPPCPSSTPGVYSNSCPLSRWCHPAISSSVVPFSSCPQSLPASGSFPVSQFFTSGGQSIGVSASKSVLLMNIQDWFPLRWTGWVSWQSTRLSRVFSNTTVQKHQSFSTQLSL